MSSLVPDIGSNQDMGELLDSSMDMGELLDSSMESMKRLRRGDVVAGVVMRADVDGIFINIGHKSEGVVPPSEMKTLEPEDLERIKEGDEIMTLVVKPETAEEGAVLSIDRAVGEQGWLALERKLQSSESVEGKIIGFNRGGAIVEVEGIQGFVPMSQLVSVSRNRTRERRDDTASQQVDEGAPEAEKGHDQEASSDDVGKALQLKVLEINRARNRAIFSERQLVQELREERKAQLIGELNEGEVRRGKVTGICSFGAFVDLGGADGLIHISELSWMPVRSPEEMVNIGDEIDVYVLRVDAEKNKIALSLRRLQPEPWETIHDHYRVGDIVDATVTKLTNFGAFARVGGTVEGLIHISELSSREINHPREVVREGDTVRLKVLRIEPERRRMGLSLKQAAEEEEDLSLKQAAAEEEDLSLKQAEEEDLSLKQAAAEEEDLKLKQAEE